MLILALAFEFYAFLPGRKDPDESAWDEIVGSTVGCSVCQQDSSEDDCRTTFPSIRF
jgi:hypothetical protein